MSRTTTTVTKTDNTRASSVIRDLLKELISTCSIDDAIERDALLRTMTKTLETLSTLIKNVTVPQIKEKHRSLNLKNLKLQNALSLRNQNVRAKVIKLLNLIGYCKKNDDDDENQLLIYCHQHSLSKIWLLEIDHAIGIVRSKSVIAMRDQMHQSSSTTTTTTVVNSKLVQTPPKKIKGPLVQVKNGKDIWIIPLPQENDTMTGLELRERIRKHLKLKAGQTFLLIKKGGNIVSDHDALKTNKKYKMKLLLQSTEEEKVNIQHLSKISRQNEKKESLLASSSSSSSKKFKLTWEQERDLINMMNIGMAPPGAKEMITQVLGQPGMEHIMPSTIASAMMNGQPPPQEVMQAMVSVGINIGTTISEHTY